MDVPGNSTDRLVLRAHRTTEAAAAPSDGSAYLYILIVMCFYGVFLSGVVFGYFRSKRREKRRTNVFTRLVHEEEKREWGALPKKQSLTFPAAAVHVTLPFCGNHGNVYATASPLACALCGEDSSVSSLCSSADTRIAIEEESDSGTGEGPEENLRVAPESSGEGSGPHLSSALTGL
ncbi:potassium voltage-gated channel subfamily E member 4 [Synchiropus picturatus]